MSEYIERDEEIKYQNSRNGPASDDCNSEVRNPTKPLNIENSLIEQDNGNLDDPPCEIVDQDGGIQELSRGER